MAAPSITIRTADAAAPVVDTTAVAVAAAETSKAPAPAPAAVKAPANSCFPTLITVVIAFAAGITVAGLVVGLSLGFAGPKRDVTTTTTTTEQQNVTIVQNVTVVKNVTVVPDWALFPPDISTWTYLPGAKNGPENWGKITNKTTGAVLYPLCADTPTSKQTPIDITTSVTTKLPGNTTLIRSYGSTAFKLKPRPGGHPGFELQSADNSSATWVVDGVSYEFLQFHYHSPSEHTVNGVRYPLEVHFVHRHSGGGLAVFGILYPFSDDNGVVPNEFLKTWWDVIFSEKAMTLQLPIALGAMIDDVAGSALYRYDGSLTTPPCTEDVKWHVAVSNQGVSKAQVYSYKFALETVQNYRDVQPLHGRVPTNQTLSLPSSTAVSS